MRATSSRPSMRWGSGRSLPRASRPGVDAASCSSAPLRSLYSSTIPSSNIRPCRRTWSRNARWNAATRAGTLAGRLARGRSRARRPAPAPARSRSGSGPSRSRRRGTARSSRRPPRRSRRSSDDEAHHVVRADARLGRHRAAGGALAALVAAGGVDAGQREHLFAQPCGRRLGSLHGHTSVLHHCCGLPPALACRWLKPSHVLLRNGVLESRGAA